MKLFLRKSILSCCLGIAVFIICTCIALLTAQYQLKLQLREDANTLLQQFNEVVAERIRVFSQLHQLNVTQCDENALRQMRRVLFDAEYVIDIGFFNDDLLICTTGVGVLDTEVFSVKPDYIINNKTAVTFEPNLNILLFPERDMEAVIVREAQFNVVIRVTKLKHLKHKLFHWQVFHTKNNQLTHLAGEQGVYQKINDGRFSSYESLLQCSTKLADHCAALYVPWRQFLSEHKKHFISAAFAILILSVGSAYIVYFLLANRRTTAYRVKTGIKTNSFYWAYQPIIDLKTGKMAGCEVLARYEDKFGAIYPDQFIPIIRRLNMSWQFTEAMINTVVKQLTEVKGLDGDFKVSINIFPCDVEQGSVAQLIDNKALASLPFKISLEITEDEYLDNQVAHSHFKSLAEAGFYLSLDDFGTGYSNLRNLNNLNFHQVKIDRSFVQDITTQGIKASMIPNIMNLVTQFNYTCVAEGIETLEQETLLQAVGVQYGQGYKYAKPMALKQFKQYIANTDLSQS